MKQCPTETAQLINLARQLSRRPPYIDRFVFTLRCPICNGQLHPVVTRIGPRFLCDCKKGA